MLYKSHLIVIIMARKKNQLETVRITIAATPQVNTYLEQLVESGLHGKNVPEAAERLLTSAIEDFIRGGTLKRIEPAK